MLYPARHALASTPFYPFYPSLLFPCLPQFCPALYPFACLVYCPFCLLPLFPYPFPGPHLCSHSQAGSFYPPLTSPDLPPLPMVDSYLVVPIYSALGRMVWMPFTCYFVLCLLPLFPSDVCIAMPALLPYAYLLFRTVLGVGCCFFVYLPPGCPACCGDLPALYGGLHLYLKFPYAYLNLPLDWLDDYYCCAIVVPSCYLPPCFAFCAFWIGGPCLLPAFPVYCRRLPSMPCITPLPHLILQDCCHHPPCLPTFFPSLPPCLTLP